MDFQCRGLKNLISSCCWSLGKRILNTVTLQLVLFYPETLNAVLEVFFLLLSEWCVSLLLALFPLCSVFVMHCRYVSHSAIPGEPHMREMPLLVKRV